MGTKSVGDPQLRVWNAVMLKLFELGWESPDWGRRPAEQVTLALAIHEMAAAVRDDRARRAIQKAAAGVVSESAQAAVAASA